MSFCMTTEYHIKSHTSLVFVNGEWLISCPDLDLVLELEDLHEIFLDCICFCISKKLEKELINFLVSKNFPIEYCQEFLNSLVDCALLVKNPRLTLKSFFPRQLDDYLSYRYAVTHADYSHMEVFEFDKKQMLIYMKMNKSATVDITNFNHSKSIFLSHPAWFWKPSAKIPALLFFCFGQKRSAIFLDLMSVSLKCIPSKGCRHPFNLYLSDPQGKFFDPGFYLYNPLKHQLHSLEEHNLENLPRKVLLFVTIQFERYQWRYRHSWAYKDLFFDLGHIIENLRYVAAHLSIQWIPQNFTFLLEQHLWEECVFCCEIGN